MKYLAFILTLLVFIPNQANALSCVAPDIQRSLGGSDTIFIGRITQIGGIMSDKNINELTAIVEQPYLGVKEGETITIYQKHWINRKPDWKESKSEQKRALFIMNKRKSTDTPVKFLLPQDIYFFGMCTYPGWSVDDVNLKAVEEYLEQKQSDHVTHEGETPNTHAQ